MEESRDKEGEMATFLIALFAALNAFLAVLNFNFGNTVQATLHAGVVVICGLVVMIIERNQLP